MKSKPRGVTNRAWDEYSTLTRKRKLEKSHLVPELLLKDVNKTRDDLIALNHEDLASLAAFALMRLDAAHPVLESYYKIMMMMLEKTLPVTINGFANALKAFKTARDGWLLEKSSGPTRFAHERALKAALAKLENDPKQAAKAEAFKLWQDWQSGKIKHKSAAAFARHVVAELPVIENTKTVESWVTQWHKAAGAKRKKQASS